MKLPPLGHPERYVGLHVYDFKTHVSVGYTGVEIRYLRESEEFRKGTAYQIYRVTEEGGLELRGTLDHRLTAKEAVCFLRHDAVGIASIHAPTTIDYRDRTPEEVKKSVNLSVQR